MKSFKYCKWRMLNLSPADGLFTPKCARKDVSPTHTPTAPCFRFGIIAVVEGVGEQWRTNIRWGCGWTETNVSCHGMSGCVSSKWCSWATAVLWVLTHFWFTEESKSGRLLAYRIIVKNNKRNNKGWASWYSVRRRVTVNRRCVGYCWCWCWL